MRDNDNDEDKKLAAFIEEYTGIHAKMGYGVGRIGFGRKPAILVIDLQKFFTDNDSPMGGKQLIRKAVENTSVLLRTARTKGVLIIYTVVGYRSDGKDMGWWPKKIKVVERCTLGSKWVEIAPEVKGEAEDIVLVKKNSSGFFGTPLNSILNSHGVDTVIVTGCVTSGCIRATVTDSFSYGYRTIVVKDCCGDQNRLPHVANLIDMDIRWADVISLKEAQAFLDKLERSE